MKTPVEHYKTMINWAEEQYSFGRVDPIEMESAIEENWYGEYCSYCNACEGQFGCDGCPLNNVKGERCCMGTYFQMNNSKTWKQWLYHARKLFEILINIEKNENK